MSSRGHKAIPESGRNSEAFTDTAFRIVWMTSLTFLAYIDWYTFVFWFPTINPQSDLRNSEAS